MVAWCTDQSRGIPFNSRAVACHGKQSGLELFVG